MHTNTFWHVISYICIVRSDKQTVLTTMNLFLLFAIVLMSLTSCSMQASYSPLDSYVKASNYSDSAKAAYRIEMKKYIDSVNNAAIVIHNSKY